MNAVRGTYYDGVHSKGTDASLLWSPVGAKIETDNGRQIVLDRESLSIPSPVPGAPLRLKLGEKESFATLDHAGMEVFRGAMVLPASLSERMEKHLPAVVAAAALTVALLASLGVWGVPALAGRLALVVSEDASAQMSAAIISQLDVYLRPSKLPSERQRELRQYFNSHGSIRNIEFRDARDVGANAVSLGATMVAFSDDLVELADNDEELLAVYLHELGHSQLRHVEQNLFRGAAWLVLLTVLTGDAGTVGEMLVNLPLSIGLAAYSRGFEQEADAFAVDRLIEAGLSPMALASILQKLEAYHLGQPEAADGNSNEQDANGNDSDRPILLSLPDYLSSHPPTSERVAYVRSRMAEFEASAADNR